MSRRRKSEGGADSDSGLDLWYGFTPPSSRCKRKLGVLWKYGKAKRALLRPRVMQS